MSHSRRLGLLAAVTLLPGVASAHVDYVTEDTHPVVAIGEFLATVFASPLNVALLVGGAVGAVGVTVTYLRYADSVTDVRVGIRTLQSYRPYLPWMLRLSLGLPLVGAGFTGYYFSPSVPIEARLLQVFVGFLLLFGLATRLVAAIGLGAYLFGLVANPSLLLASEYIGGFLAIIAVGPGQPSADMMFRRIAVTDGTLLSRLRELPTPGEVVARAGFTPGAVPLLLRVGLGANFVYLGVAGKWLQPGRALTVVSQYDLTSVVPVAPELWVFGAGLVEIGVGVLFITGCFTRGAAATGFLILTTTLFGLPNDPVLAHVTLFGLSSALLVTGSGPYSLDAGLIPRLHERLKPASPPRRTAGDQTAD